MNAAISPAKRHVAIDKLDQAIVDLSAKINAATYELLVLIREFDERAGWLKWGLSSCTQWLHWRCDLSLSAAREKIRAAHALKGLPEISTAFASGALSYSKVRALTRVATSDNESSLLSFAMTTTAARVEERCRQIRNVQPGAVAHANRAHRARSLRTWHDHERGMMTITIELPIEDGELIDQALNKALEIGPTNGPEFEDVSFAAQRADALLDVAKSYLHGSADSRTSSADNYQVIVHVDQSALADGEGRSDLPLESVTRLLCDGSVVTLTENGQGEPLTVGRRQRTITTAIRRALWARDGGCAFPGCTHTRYVDAHHVRHWSDGGETGVDNLLLLCSQHHRLVHEGGYEDSQGLSGSLVFQASGWARYSGQWVSAGGHD